MRLPKLTPLQSRLAASLGASLSLIVLYLILCSPRLAYAADTDPNEGSTYGIDTGSSGLSGDYGVASPELMGQGLEGLFGGNIVVRDVPAGATVLDNNKPEAPNIDPGETQHYVFLKEALAGPKSPIPSLVPDAGTEGDEGDELERRADPANSTTPLYISLNTCLVPFLKSSDASNDEPLPQLKVYISQSKSLQKPGPDVDSSDQIIIEADGGFVGTTVNATGDVFIGVSAPNLKDFSEVYNYEIAASIDAPYHDYNEDTPDLYFVDGDSYTALLVTNDVTTQSDPGDEEFKKWMEADPPFTMFAQNTNDTSISGLEKSYCGLKKFSKISKNTDNVKAGMTSRGIGGRPKEQFYITSLNESSIYYGFLAIDSNSSSEGNVGGGGKVWKAMNFTTKAGMYNPLPSTVILFSSNSANPEHNCALVFNLEFCSEVAYAVPSNSSIEVDGLMKLYDSHASALYKNFSRSLQQIACNASSTSRYSLASDCDHCASAYKQWLCAVTIPRCSDFSSNLPFLRARNTGQPFLDGSTLDESSIYHNDPWANSSRNPIIDTEIRPGPYKEVLPCQDLCYDLVQSCPAALGFGCPEGNSLNASYGTRSPDGDITCSYLGAAYFLNAGWKVIEGTRLALWALTAFWAANLALAL
ncbi:stretch-activated cation channel mid1 [Arachnomyces sp. PD_36]|nr:stretch-activated cation channel mid1 [Arachnomyces sp. PD_36]